MKDSGPPTSGNGKAQVQSAGLTIDIEVPERWESIVDETTSAPIVLIEEDLGQPFRASMVVTVDELSPGVELNDWQRPNEVLLERQSDEYQLLDLERIHLAQQSGARRLACYRSPQGVSVTMEQWMAVVGSYGLTMTATAATMVFPRYLPELHRYMSTIRCTESRVS